MKESFGFIERADKVSEVRFLKVRIQFSINTVELRCTDTSLLRRVFFVPGEKALTFFLNKTRLIWTPIYMDFNNMICLIRHPVNMETYYGTFSIHINKWGLCVQDVLM